MVLPISGIPVAQPPSQAGGNAFQSLGQGFQVGAAMSDRMKQKRINKRVKTIMSESGLSPEDKLQAIAGEDLKSAMEYGNFLMLGRQLAWAELQEDHARVMNPLKEEGARTGNALQAQELEFRGESNPLRLAEQRLRNAGIGQANERSSLQGEIERIRAMVELGGLGIGTRSDFAAQLMETPEGERGQQFGHFAELMGELDNESVQVGSILLQSFMDDEGNVDLSDANLERVLENADVGYFALQDFGAGAERGATRYNAVIDEIRRSPGMDPAAAVNLAAQAMGFERDPDGLYLDYNGEPMDMQGPFARSVLRDAGITGGGQRAFETPSGGGDSGGGEPQGVSSSLFGNAGSEAVQSAWATPDNARSAMQNIVRNAATHGVRPLTEFLTSVPATGVTTADEAEAIAQRMVNAGTSPEVIENFDPRNHEDLATLGMALAQLNGSEITADEIVAAVDELLGGSQ